MNAATQVSVSHGQAVLTEPRLVELLLRNSGRRDVQSSDFVNGADSLVFDFGVPVISVLDSRTQPSTSAIPQLSYSGNELQIHPGLIAKGQTLELAVLVDGGKRDVDVKFATILETPVKRGDQGDFETTSTRLFRFANVAGPIIGVAAMIALTISSIIALENSSDLIRRDRDLMEESSAELRKASDNLDLLRKCRYWDLRDPERAKKECPRVLKPN
ncbi:hypothetical protein AB0Q95_00060 [Streptomyces sp. NPDC059900]|uniref:hypothetical protein n=1 Tax=Streptomyces sp. NPDC059900 TaxID=3155816 RepID=UPI00342F84CF